MRGWLLFLGGCGRLAFDAGPDAGRDASVSRICEAPVGHDEDGDGVDDACDGCPHRSDPAQPDLDGDGVNDGCDPRPDLPGDSIALFDPFVAPDPAWMRPAVQGTYSGDSLIADLRGDQRLAFRRNFSVGFDTVTFGGYVGDGAPGEMRQLTVGVSGTTTGTGSQYYCELQGTAPTGKLAVTYSPDGVDYEVLARSDGPVIGNGRFEMTFSSRYPVVTCDTTWPVPQMSVTDTIPVAIPAVRIGFSAAGVVVQIDYFVHIHSD